MLKKFQSFLTLCLVYAGLGSSSEIAYEYKDGSMCPPKDGGICVTDQQPNHPCPDTWRFSGDFLYLLPTVDDTYYVLDGAPGIATPNGTRKNNDFGYSPGFRLGAEFACCDHHREVQASFAFLGTQQNRTISGDNLWASVGRPDFSDLFENYAGTASSHLQLYYEQLDVNFSQQMGNSYGMYFYFQPGIEYAYLRLNERISYFEEVAPRLGQIDEKSSLWGVGPQIGLVLDANFLHERLTCSTTHAFSFIAQFSGSLLVGRGKTTNFESVTTPVDGTGTLLSVKDEHTLRTFPALHARAGLSYNISGEDVGGSLEIGYEFNSYLRALSRSIFVDDVADALALTNYYNFDVQGLYVSAKLSF